MMQHIFYFIEEKYFLWLFIVNFGVNKFSLSLANVISGTVDGEFYGIDLFALDLS